MIALGLMSGTSMDGIDAAIVTTDGERVVSTGPWATYPYEPALRAELAAVVEAAENADPGALGALETALTDANAAAVLALLRDNGLSSSDIDIVGFHGQTVLHRPDRRVTRQLGDGGRLARAIGIDVVNDFRSADVAAGGQGAPFAPLYHLALAKGLERPLAVLNLGGVANVTYIGTGGPDDVLAFDTGPGNAMIDDWVAGHTGRRFDEDGRLAAAGTPDRGRLARLLAHGYFALAPPKSLDRNDFSAAALAGLSTADGAATLTAFAAAAIARGRAHLPAPPKRWLVGGGGRHNA
ncbi:MAG: anhydro-N-acetylmuramic acid kinase, partial [Inquilinus sp.]|nr:anhydro-N-acetylmuramic acid kinase [Inquilinus sp.]